MIRMSLVLYIFGHNLKHCTRFDLMMVLGEELKRDDQSHDSFSGEHVQFLRLFHLKMELPTLCHCYKQSQGICKGIRTHPGMSENPTNIDI